MHCVSHMCADLIISRNNCEQFFGFISFWLKSVFFSQNVSMWRCKNAHCSGCCQIVCAPLKHWISALYVSRTRARKFNLYIVILLPNVCALYIFLIKYQQEKNLVIFFSFLLLPKTKVECFACVFFRGQQARSEQTTKWIYVQSTLKSCDLSNYFCDLFNRCCWFFSLYFSPWWMEKNV